MEEKKIEKEKKKSNENPYFLLTFKRFNYLPIKKINKTFLSNLETIHVSNTLIKKEEHNKNKKRKENSTSLTIHLYSHPP